MNLKLNGKSLEIKRIHCPHWAESGLPNEILKKKENRTYYALRAASAGPKANGLGSNSQNRGGALGRPAGGDGGRNRRAAALRS
jgi:hypothetical protein